MRIVTIEEDGKNIKCYEGDFICLDQMMDDAIEILKPYSSPSAVQYLELAKKLVHQRRMEIFNGRDSVCISTLLSEGDAPDIAFQDTRMCRKN